MKNFAVVGLRLLAIWAFLQALFHLSFIGASLPQGHDNLLAPLLILLLYLIVSYILYVKAPTIASHITDETEESDITTDYEKLASVLFATAGLLITFWSSESVFRTINSLFLSRAQYSETLYRNIFRLLFGGGIQMIIGLGLFIGSKKIAGWWHKFRHWT